MTIGTKDPLMQRFVKAVRRLKAYSSLGTVGATQLVPIVSASGSEVIGSVALSDLVTGSGIAVALTGAQTVAGAKTFSTMPIIPAATVAAAGADQAGAAAITTGFTLVTGADDNKGVRLPAAVAGLVCIIKVGDGADLKVYPATGDAINAIAANSAMTVVDDVALMLVALDATTWYTLPLLPS